MSKPTILSSAQQPASAPLQQTSIPAAAPSKEPEPEPEPTGWEEPTTVQHPSWEPDPSPAVDLPSEEPKLESPVPEESQVPSRSPTPAQEPAPEPTPATVEPPSQSPAPSLSDPATTSVTTIPSSLKSAPRTATSSSRASARNRLIDQPVVMPSSFGSVERVGMQFGSLSLNGESLFESTSTSCVLFVYQFFLYTYMFFSGLNRKLLQPVLLPLRLLLLRRPLANLSMRHLPPLLLLQLPPRHRPLLVLSSNRNSKLLK